MDNNRPRRRPPARNIDGFVVPENKKVDGLKPRPLHKPEPISPISKMADSGSMLNTTIPGKIYPSTPVDMHLNSKTKPPKQKKKRSKKKIIGLTALAIIILALVGGGWDAWQLYHKLHKLNVGNLTASVGGAENILVAGSTNRCNLKVQNSQWGFCSDGVTGVNSDIIFIVHLVPSTHTASLLSIPRDTFVPNARSGDEAFKIDAALYQGPTQLVTAVEQDFGIPIQHYAEVGFDGFVNIVNAVGGIKMNFPMPVYDSESYLNVQQPGCHELNGVEALQVVRARHLQYKPATVTTSSVHYWPQEAESDIARIARTHEFLKVLASTVAGKGVSNPLTDQKLIDAVAPQIQVDNGLSTSTMINLLQTFHAVDVNNVPEYTLPIVTPGFGNYDYQGAGMGDVVFPIEQTDEQIIDKFLGTGSTANTMSGKPLPEAQSVAVNVINGSGVSEQAEGISDELQKLGFNISSQPTSTTPVSSQAQETVVYYANKVTEADALAVANKLTGYVILSQNSNKVTAGSEVTVITGTDAAVSSPNASASSSTTTSPTTTANSASSSSTSPLGPVSASNAALAAWDPIACSVNQKVVPNNSNL
ncbi:MAG: LCP family protein, partial [Candidatus Saccharibacteria bacterium]